MSTVTVISGPAEGLSLDIDRELIVGREGADLTIEDREISRHHLALRPVEQGVEVEDLKSLNGTSVNGEKISTVHTLTSTGTVKIGKSELRIDVDVPPPEPEGVDALGEAFLATDVTAPRQSPAVQTPDVTVDSPVPEPEVTAPRRIAPGTDAQPQDVTARRPVAPPVVPPEQPRPEGEAAAVATPAAPPTPPAPPVEPAAPEPPAQGRPPGPPPRRRRRGSTIVLALAGVFVLSVVAVLALANAGGSHSTRALNAVWRVATVTHGSTDELLAGVQGGPPTGAGSVTVDIHLRPGKASLDTGAGPGKGDARRMIRAGWTCFTLAGESFTHCAPPAAFQHRDDDIPLAVFDSSGATFLGTEDMIRNGAYHGQPCRLQGGGRYQSTNRGYVACLQFSPAAGVPGTAQALKRAGWTCFPVTTERLIHCAPPGALQRGAADVPLLVFDTKGATFLGPEDMIRNDAYRGQMCPFEGGGLYHVTGQGYVACHGFRLVTSTPAFSAHVVHSFDGGSMTSLVSGTATPTGSGSVSYKGTGDFTGGTSSYDGTKGSYTLTGTLGRTGQGRFKLVGTVKY